MRELDQQTWYELYFPLHHPTTEQPTTFQNFRRRERPRNHLLAALAILLKIHGAVGPAALD